jgi:hypothetical protein
MKSFVYKTIQVLSGCALISGSCFGWGDRGHMTVTDVAVELIRAHQGHESEFTKLLVEKRSQLAYLSTVPDILWRNQDRDTAAKNAPTHFIDLDYLGELTPQSAPRDVTALLARISELCKNPPSKAYKCPASGNKSPEEVVGTAPMRISQLYALAVSSLKNASAAKSDSDRNKAVDQALLYLGINSHFIGDLANPMHTSKDYDGWDAKQGGLHGYFESDVVNAWNISLQSEVMARALKRGSLRPYQREKPFDATRAAYAYAFESFAVLPKLFQWDRAEALRKESSEERGMRLKAQRRNPSQVIKSAHTRDLVADRLSAGAHELASLWQQAWNDAGTPNLKNYQSFSYHYTPEFIPLP